MSRRFEALLEFKAFSSKYGANAVSADIDGDGYDEIVVAPGPGPQNDAVLRIFKSDGTFIAEHKVFDSKYGLTLSSGDIDGDWKDEIIAGLGPDPKNRAVVKAYKADGTIIMSFTPYDETHKYGVNVAAADLDGDGIDEIITGIGPGPQNPSLMKIFKSDGSEIGSFLAYPDQNNYGVKVFPARTGE